jgi:hypothetical protein
MFTFIANTPDVVRTILTLNFPRFPGKNSSSNLSTSHVPALFHKSTGLDNRNQEPEPGFKAESAHFSRITSATGNPDPPKIP